MGKGPLTSKQLGIPYPWVQRIFLDGCGSSDPIHNMEGLEDLWIAHTHVCNNDPFKGTICFGEGAEIFNSRGYLSTTFWHEYAHLLVGGDDFPCPDDRVAFEANFDEIQKRGHNAEWRKVMLEMGQSVPLRYYPYGELLEMLEND